MWAGIAACALFALGAGVFFSCTTGQNEEQVAVELADKLTDSMEFKDAQTKTGTPPAENKGSSQHPQIQSMDGTRSMAAGQTLQFNLYTDYPLPAEVKGALVQVLRAVKGEEKIVTATKYLEVPGVVTGATEGGKGGRMPMTGTFNPSDGLSDSGAFTLRFAMFKQNGEIGNYYEWAVNVGGGGGDGGSAADSGTPVKRCTSPADCTSGQTCNIETGQCVAQSADGGIGPLTCTCTEADCTAFADCGKGITFTPMTAGCDTWPDKNKCSGWHSVVLASGVWPEKNIFNDGEMRTMEACTIRLNCPMAAF
jgi:hypothetical protein